MHAAYAPASPARTYYESFKEMARSTIRVAAETAADIFQMFALLGLRLVGTKDCAGDLAVIIEGDAVPECDQVMCKIEKSSSEGGARFDVSFEAVNR